ncbi:uncharacterized protein LOC110247402, partial [Exaiptasia diaphana]|uniref:ShKT domain-containing protein n=1 Tax=Exaiptasia diaphana TaxID=2652724 RepID=A0A913XSC7_EXADI
MKLLLTFLVIFGLVAYIGAAPVEDEPEAPELSEADAPEKDDSTEKQDAPNPQETVAKRVALRKDILSAFSCRYLKIKGFLTKDIKLKNLCLTTFHCNDVLSKQCCKIVKGRNDCGKDNKLSLTYCRFTCNKCGAG